MRVELKYIIRIESDKENKQKSLYPSAAELMS